MPCRLGKQRWDKLLLSLGLSQEDRPQLPRQNLMLHVHLEFKQLLPWRLGKQLRDTLLLPYRLDKEDCPRHVLHQRHVLHVCRGDQRLLWFSKTQTL